jgi:voltage-gated potassium channel
MPNREQIRPYDLAIVVLSAFVLLALAITTLTSIQGPIRTVLEYADYAVCAVFLGDFVHRLKTASSRKRYMLESGWLDLISSIPTIPAFRLGRLTRLFRAFKVFRGIRSAKHLADHLMKSRVESTVSMMLLVAFLAVILAAVAVLQFETDLGSNILTAEDALWWAYATVITVGYGDRYPVTTEGRLVGAVLMIVGIGVYGVITGISAAWFVSPRKHSSSEKRRRMEAREEDHVLVP